MTCGSEWAGEPGEGGLRRGCRGREGTLEEGPVGERGPGGGT